MLRTLWSDATDGFPDRPPAGSVIPGGLGGCLAEALRRPSKVVGESKRSKRPRRIAELVGDSFLAAGLHQAIGDRFWI
jgi:hypothetical protein